MALVVKRREKLQKGVNLLHQSMSVHWVDKPMCVLKDLQYEYADYPGSSSKLSPSNEFLFPKLKIVRGEGHFGILRDG